MRGVVICFSFLVSLFIAQDIYGDEILKRFRELEPSLAKLEKTETRNGPFWMGYNAQGDCLGIFVLTSAIARKESLGYSGTPVPAILLLNPDTLKIIKIKFLPNNETPVYVGDMFKPEFARQYIGKGPDSAFEAGKDVEAISGATYTTSAINRSIREALRRVKAALTKQKSPEPMPYSLHLLQTIVVASLFVIATIALIMRLARIRLVLLAASVLFLGFIWAGLMLSARNIVDLILHPTDFVSGPFFHYLPLLILLFGGFGLSVIFGRFYCGYICPFGALCEIFWTFNPKKIRVKPNLARKLRFIKYVLFGLLLLFGFLLPRVDILKWIEPFGPTYRMMDAIATATALSIIGISFFVFRFYCRFMCPLGAIFEGLSFLRLFRRRMIPRKCRACGDCVLICPTAAIHWKGKKVVFDPSLCFNCADCAVERRGKECTK